MNTNIPLYRAKKIDGDEYVIGFLFKDYYNFKWFIHDSVQTDEIDPSTLSIHFPDMLDSEGGKIFASLSEDGKGGDEFEFEIYCYIEGWLKEKGLLVYDSEEFAFKVHCEYEGEVRLYDMQTMSRLVITGIKQ